MFAMTDSLRGIMRIKCVCPDIGRFLNDLKESSVSFRNCVYLKGAVSFEIYRSDLDILKAIASKNGVLFEISEERGIIFLLIRYAKRFGIYIGVLLGTALIFLLSNTVLDIEVYGCENISEDAIIAALSEQGIRTGTFIPTVNFHSVERAIRITEDDLSWIGIRSVGCRIIAEVDETVYPPETESSKMPCNVVASRDAQIVYAEVYNGELVPMIGEGVRKNELLISGTCEGKYGLTRLVHASGKIIGRYEEKQLFSQPLTYSERMPDECITRRVMYFGGLEIPLSSGSVPDTADAEITMTENPIRFMNLTLPIGIRNSEYQIYRSENITIESDTAYAKIEEMIKIYEDNFIQSEDIKIINKEIQRNITDNNAEIVVKYTLEGDICSDREIFAKKQEPISEKKREPSFIFRKNMI